MHLHSTFIRYRGSTNLEQSIIIIIIIIIHEKINVAFSPK